MTKFGFLLDFAAGNPAYWKELIIFGIFEKYFASLGKVETTISSKKGTRNVKHLDIVEVQIFLWLRHFLFIKGRQGWHVCKLNIRPVETFLIPQ